MTMTIRDRINAIEAKNEGIAEGISMGITEGISRVAAEMIKGNMPYESIAKFTKLSLEEIYKIRDSLTG